MYLAKLFYVNTTLSCQELPILFQLTDPLVDLILHETDDHYHITCQMSEICTEALLSLVVKNGTASHPLQSKLNSSCTQETHTIRKEAYVLKSEMTKHTVSCKPLTDNEQLNERLAQNKYLCEGQSKFSFCIDII